MLKIDKENVHNLLLLQDTFHSLTPKEYFLCFKDTLCSVIKFERIKPDIEEKLLHEDWEPFTRETARNAVTSSDYEVILLKGDFFIRLRRSGDDPFCTLEFAYPFDHNSYTIKKFEKKVLEHTYKNTASKFFILTKDEFGLTIKDFTVEVPNDINLEHNYGEGFGGVNDIIMQKIAEFNSGLFVFHGESGCGKSTYIKKLAESLPEKRFIYIPEFMVTMLNDPAIISMFIEQKNAVIVIEDAEKIIVDRGDNDNSLVPILLNISDGILSDVLKIPIILTYNTNTENIDKALLRKGRLKYKHEFKPLPFVSSQKILQSMGYEDCDIEQLRKDDKVKEKMALCDIYNLHDEVGHKYVKKKNKVGF